MDLRKRLGSMVLPGAGVSEKQYIWAPGMAVTNRKAPQTGGKRSGSKTRSSPQSFQGGLALALALPQTSQVIPPHSDATSPRPE